MHTFHTIRFFESPLEIGFRYVSPSRKTFDKFFRRLFSDLHHIFIFYFFYIRQSIEIKWGFSIAPQKKVMNKVWRSGWWLYGTAYISHIWDIMVFGNFIHCWNCWNDMGYGTGHNIESPHVNYFSMVMSFNFPMWVSRSSISTRGKWPHQRKPFS